MTVQQLLSYSFDNMVIHCDTTRFIWEVLEGNEYRFLFDRLKVLDLGCNIGTFSFWIYPHAERIWAVDKEQRNIDLLNQSIRDNSFTNITTITSEISTTNSLASLMSGHSIGAIDVLKVDIEGAELEMVEAEDFPAHKITTIIGEHHYGAPSSERFENRLIKLGYRYTELPYKHFIARK